MADLEPRAEKLFWLKLCSIAPGQAESDFGLKRWIGILGVTQISFIFIVLPNATQILKIYEGTLTMMTYESEYLRCSPVKKIS